MATDYAPDKIRNVVLLGHSHDGKTMLAEAMLFASGGVARMGSPDQSTATTDFEPEEQKRKISINLGVAFVEHNGHKINILDAPGFLDFAGQVASGLRAAEGAVVVVGPSPQLAVGTEIAWEQCNRTNKPRIVVVNKLDKENSDFYGAVAAMRKRRKDLVDLADRVIKAESLEGAELAKLLAKIGRAAPAAGRR